MRGLIGRDDFEGMLLLVPCRDIHTFGMRKRIDVAFVDRKGTVVESHRDVPPLRRLKCRAAAATLERIASEEPWFSPGEHLDYALHAS